MTAARYACICSVDAVPLCILELGNFDVAVAPTHIAEEVKKRVRKGNLSWSWVPTAWGNP
jgi:hypothetical protein